MKTVTGKKFRLPGLGRVPRGFPGNGLGTFHSISCILGAPTRHQYRRGYDASPTRRASPFATGHTQPATEYFNLENDFQDYIRPPFERLAGPVEPKSQTKAGRLGPTLLRACHARSCGA